PPDHLRARPAGRAAQDLAPGTVRQGRLALRVLRDDRGPAHARPCDPEIARRRVGLGERRDRLRPLQPPEGKPDAGGGADGARPSTQGPCAGAVHSPSRAENPERLAAVPGALRRRGHLDGLKFAPFDREPELLPLAPGARVEPGVPARQVQTVEDGGRSHARAAIDDDLSFGEPAQRLVPRGVQRTRYPPRTRSIGFGSPRQRDGIRASTTTSSPRLRSRPAASIVSSLRSRGVNWAGSV